MIRDEETWTWAGFFLTSVAFVGVVVGRFNHESADLGSISELVGNQDTPQFFLPFLGGQWMGTWGRLEKINTDNVDITVTLYHGGSEYLPTTGSRASDGNERRGQAQLSICPHLYHYLGTEQNNDVSYSFKRSERLRLLSSSSPLFQSLFTLNVSSFCIKGGTPEDKNKHKKPTKPRSPK